MALTYWARALPWWLLLPAGAWVTAWHHSLQHELIHNHPTRKLWLNTALGFLPLSLWLPYLRYRELHLSHHRDQVLTDPIEDPESYYLTDIAWQRRGPVSRAVTRILNTATGRIMLGPLVAISHFLVDEVAGLAAGSVNRWRVWGVHVVGVIAVLLWVEAVCGIPFWEYVAFFVYPGLALTALRSFAEHRAALDPDHRTAIVERAPVLGLLFLFNNLHVVHHCHPAMPWYAIPRHYRQNRDSIIRRNNGLVYRGYRDVIKRYLVREHHAPVTPLSRLPAPPQPVLLARPG
ncbi:MAG TPA: fatty acid desaturase [Stellaceae bacterium]|nr:fatty acid desaturase [Stellaceae bacterium]